MTQTLANLATKTIHQIDEQNIEYCLLRNFGFLSGANVEGDVDVLVSNNDRETIDDFLLNSGFRRGRGDTTHQTRYLRFHLPSRRLFVLDVYWDTLTYNGLPLIDGERVMKNSREYQGVLIPSREDLFVELLFHGGLNKNGFRDEYRKKLNGLRNTVDEETVLKHAGEVFGEGGREVAKAAMGGKLDRVVSRKWRLVSRKLIEDPSLVPDFFRNLIWRREITLPLRRTIEKYNPMHPTAVIAILGPDGAGKTTVAQEIETILNRNGFDVRVAKLGTYNEKSWLFRVGNQLKTELRRNLGQFFPGKISPENKPMKSIQNNEKQSLPPKKPKWKAIIHLVDILIRYGHTKIGSRGVVVADRFVHDIVIYDDFEELHELVFQLFEPEEFTGILLIGNAETIANRSEYDIKSVERMMSDLKQLDLVSVDATQDLDIVVGTVLKEIFSNQNILDYSNYL